MVSSSAKSVDEYLAELEPERRKALTLLRAELLATLPAGLEEVMNWGMICYQIPFATLSDTYNDQPLVYAGLASQKQHISLYLMSIYAFEDVREKFETDWRATGKRFDVGKSCIRFKSLDDVPMEVVREAAGKISIDKYVEHYLASRGLRKRSK